MGSDSWDLEIGQTLSREERRRRFGGSQYSGIAPSAQTSNVFIYSDPSASNEFGYNYDGWNRDRTVYSYTGEGQEGDQTLQTPGNAAILHHRRDGKAIRLFEADGRKPGSNETIQRYAGSLVLDDAQPFRTERASDRNGRPRSVIVFHLLPEDGTDRRLVLREHNPEQTADPKALEWSTEFVDRETALEALRNIPVEIHDDGTQAPYQHLVLLWAISAALRGVAQPVPYSVAKPQVEPILNRFAIAKSPTRVENLWLALGQSPWWTILNQVSRNEDVPSSDMVAGLSSQIIRLLDEDGIFTSRAVAEIEAVLTDEDEDNYGIDWLLDDLGLKELKPSKLIPVESNVTDTFSVNVSEVSDESRNRAEADLQNAYKAHLEKIGHRVTSVEIFDEGQTLRVDLFDVDEQDLIEAKSSAGRESVRLGLGQILDYARHVDHRRKTLLLPEKPSKSLVKLLTSHGVRVVYRTARGDFVENWFAEKNPWPPYVPDPLRDHSDD
jgi:hypothetical protein